jgi:hypothetical protein
LGRSIDRASRSRHSKFKPVVLGEIQAAGDRAREVTGVEASQWGVAADAEAGTDAGVFVEPFSGHPTLTLK